MIPQEFDYTAPSSLQETLTLIESGERKLLAGGMTLIPMMKLRLAAPAEVVDLGRVPGLAGIEESQGVIRIGAMTTHHAVESSPVVRAHAPLLAATAGHIGDMQVRNMGTMGGSIAHADPAADYPAALLALEAEIHLVSAHSERTVPAAEFFLDAFTTALEPGEMVLEILVHAQDVTEGSRYEKAPHPASGFAVVGVAARIQKAGGRISLARIGVTGLAGRAFRARNAESILEGGGTIAEAAAVVGEGEDVNSDLYAAAEYRLHLARVHAARALTAAAARAV
ncbi:MAG TPA: xanthine dehydrogenase family protein subunit M [Bryobacteraceae bacterium]|jgi:carbon-monoxide dehydrogenase medium subunit|nr:xanthine dehydrogenase family protein subunit M [Bryobacteraceae bacterium]